MAWLGAAERQARSRPGPAVVAPTVRVEADPTRLSAACADILATLPSWFGQPTATAAYVRNIPRHRTLVAAVAGQVQGLLSLKPHFDRTGEVWLMAVRADRRRQGVGRALMTAAIDEARLAGWRQLVLTTLSPRSADPGYAETRRFYAAMGFEPLLDLADDDPENPATNPMMWMWREV